MSSLRGRIGLALLVFGLTTLLAVGGTLWVALRDLHRDAALGALTQLTLPYASFLRADDPGGPGQSRRAGPGVVARLRDGVVRAGDASFSTFAERVQDEIDPDTLSVILIEGPDSLFINPGDRTSSSLRSRPDIEVGPGRGQVATGTTAIDGLGEALYAATPIRDAPRGGPARTLVLAIEDDSARLATADLVRALTLAGLTLLIIGIPIAVGLSASVTRPLRRLSAATEDIAAGSIPAPLPTSGPTEVAEASAAFNAMASEVEATRETQRQLLADIRHDLRTPLTVIGGFSEALKDGTARGDDAVRAADAISDETDRLGRMLDDLDHLTMPGIAEPRLHVEALDGLGAAQAAVERFTAEAASRGQPIGLWPGATPAAVLADSDALDRILGNLIANALSHAPSPGGQVHLEVAIVNAIARPGTGPVTTGVRDALLAVRDDGPGIPAAALPHVFARFYRADPSRLGGGSGLGLAIVSDLAEALGGQAFAENLPERGARVGIVLPLRA